MYYVNLFHEAIDEEIARAHDPLRWILVVGALVLTTMLFWMAHSSWIFQQSRAAQTRAMKTRDRLNGEIAALKTSDAGKLLQIQRDVRLLEERTREHPRMATLLDFLISATPRHTQITQLRFFYEIVKNNPAVSSQAALVHRPILSLDVLTQASTRVDALTQRDSLVEFFRTNQTWRALAGYPINGAGDSSKTEVEVASGQAETPLLNEREPSASRKFRLGFTLKLPMKGRPLE